MIEKEYPTVFVLILSYNGKIWLKECLPSVLSSDYPNFEVVVIDNGSSDGTVEYLRNEHPTVRTLTVNPNVGYSRGFNVGLHYAANKGADYFLVMNNDTVIDSHALSALVKTASSNQSAGFVTGKVFFYDRPEILQTVGKRVDPGVWKGEDIGYCEVDEGQYEAEVELAFADDVFTLVSRKMYEQVGGYDPELFLQCEEWDWQLRAKNKGWRIYYSPAAKLWHRVSASTGGPGSPIVAYFLYRNRMVIVARYGGRARLFAHFFVTGAEVVDRFLRGLVQLDWKKLKPQLARLLGYMAGSWWIMRHQPSTKVPALVQWLAKG